MMKFAKQIIAALLCVGALSTAAAQPTGGPGPGPVPDPWINNGGTLYYDQGGITVPSTVTGGTKGVGTINARALYVNGVPVFSNSGTVIFASRVDAAIGADQNNWTPTGTGTYSTASAVFVNGGLGDFNVTGLTGGVEGRFIWLSNSGSTNNIVVKNQSGSSTATNRFLLVADVTLPPNMGVALRYDATAGRWRQADFYQSASPNFTGTITAQSIVLTGPTVSTPLVNVTGSTPPANGIYLSGTNKLGIATNGTPRAEFDATGSLFWLGSSSGPGIINQSASLGPTLVPDKSQPTTGIGGPSGNVTIYGQGVPGLNVDSTGATTSTSAWRAGNTHLATNQYADVAGGLFCTDASSAVNVFIGTCPNLTEPFQDGQVVTFVSPLTGIQYFKLSGSSNSYLIYDPGMTGTLTNEATSASADIKQGARYSLRYYSSGSYWQLITPPKTYTEATPPVTYTYFQNSSSSTTALDSVFQFEVYSPTKGWITQYGGIIGQELFNGSAYLDGTPNSSLTVGKGYHVYTICTGACASMADVKMDFVSRYFDGANASASFKGTIVGTALSIDGGAVIPPCGLDICGTVQVGQVISCDTCILGTYVVSGSGTAWVVNHSQTVGYTSITGSPAKAFNMGAAPGRPMFIDAQGFRGEYLGMFFARSNTDITSYFTRAQALGLGTKPGNMTSSSPFSVYPRQPLTTVSSSGAASQPITGSVNATTLAELSTNLETYWMGHEWEPFNDFRTLGSYNCSAQGVVVRLQIVATNLTGAGGDTVLFDQTRTCPGIGDMPWDETVSWPFSDAIVLYKMKGSVSGGTATFSFQPQSRMAY